VRVVRVQLHQIYTSSYKLNLNLSERVGKQLCVMSRKYYWQSTALLVVLQTTKGARACVNTSKVDEICWLLRDPTANDHAVRDHQQSRCASDRSAQRQAASNTPSRQMHVRMQGRQVYRWVSMMETRLVLYCSERAGASRSMECMLVLSCPPSNVLD
jgi:hypothetical protein